MRDYFVNWNSNLFDPGLTVAENPLEATCRYLAGIAVGAVDGGGAVGAGGGGGWMET